MGKYSGKETIYQNILNDAKQYLEEPPMIALPGGTWCPFCGVELCKNGRHRNSQLLQLLVVKMARQIEQVNADKVLETETPKR